MSKQTRGKNPEREAVKEYLQQYHDAKAKKQISGHVPKIYLG